MAKGSNKGRRRVASRQIKPTPYQFRKWAQSISDSRPKKCPNTAAKKEWEDAMCSVCMEYPHNAVLLLCSSHEKGCRPYMCGTSCRYSNCLDQYKKAYTKLTTSNLVGLSQGTFSNPIVISDSSALPTEKSEVPELLCPLCRGQVKGWTVVEPAREYLNSKERTCMHENCSFVGTYKELKKHVKAEHPSARPREVDPALEQKWRRLERERERDDVISTIRSTMPGAMVFGDYVIEGAQFGFGAEEDEDGLETGFDGSNLVNVLQLLQAFGHRGNVDLGRRLRRGPGGAVGLGRSIPVGGSVASDRDGWTDVAIEDDDEDDDDDDDEDGRADGGDGRVSLVRRIRRQGRVILGRSGRRRRRREGNGSAGAR